MRHLYAILGACSLLAGTSFADIINVPGDYPTIQAAIDAAIDSDVIYVDKGTYFENVDYLGKSIEVRALHGSAETTIDGQLQDSVVRMDGCSGTTLLQGFTIKKGLASYGGGLHIDDCSSVSLWDCVVRTNAANSGAGLHIENSTLTMNDCAVVYNSTNGGTNAGGGLYASNSAITFSGGEISTNNVSGAGGGMFLGDCQFLATNAIFTSNVNSSEHGGFAWVGNTSCTISNSLISDNTTEYKGGAFYLSDSCQLNLHNCSGSGNYATNSVNVSAAQGGFVYMPQSGCVLTVTNCAFSRGAENFSAYRGGFAYAGYGSVIDISGSLLADFEAYNSGEAIYLSGQSSVFIEGSTFCSMGTSGQAIYGKWIDKGGNTFPSECPPIVEAGACCTNGICVLVDEPTCNEYYGIFYGSGTVCEDLDCPEPPSDWGACCLSQDICIIATESDCLAAQGLYQGDTSICQSADCSILPLDYGACCLGYDVCVATREVECADGGGTFAGIGVICADAGCPETCLGDINGDGLVNVNDLLTIIANWGPCP